MRLTSFILFLLAACRIVHSAPASAADAFSDTKSHLLAAVDDTAYLANFLTTDPASQDAIDALKRVISDWYQARATANLPQGAAFPEEQSAELIDVVQTLVSLTGASCNQFARLYDEYKASATGIGSAISELDGITSVAVYELHRAPYDNAIINSGGDIYSSLTPCSRAYPFDPQYGYGYRRAEDPGTDGYGPENPTEGGRNSFDSTLGRREDDFAGTESGVESLGASVASFSQYVQAGNVDEDEATAQMQGVLAEATKLFQATSGSYAQYTTDEVTSLAQGVASIASSLDSACSALAPYGVPWGSDVSESPLAAPLADIHSTLLNVDFSITSKSVDDRPTLDSLVRSWVSQRKGLQRCTDVFQPLAYAYGGGDY